MKRNITLRTLLIASLFSVACGGLAEDTGENQEALGNAGGKIVFASSAKQAIRASGEGHRIPFAVNGLEPNTYMAYTRLVSVAAGAGTGTTVQGIPVQLHVGNIQYKIESCTLGADVERQDYWFVFQPIRELRRYKNCVVSIWYDGVHLLKSNLFTLDMWLTYNDLANMEDDAISARSQRVTFKMPSANLAPGPGRDLAWAIYNGVRNSAAGMAVVSLPSLGTNALYRNNRKAWNFSAPKTLLWW